MRRYTKIITIILLLASIGLYAFFQGYELIKGPVVEITSPTDNSSVADPSILIEGYAKNISFIYLNGRQIFVDTEGMFDEKLLLLPGYNIISIRATDKFNREVRRELHLILENNE